MKKASSRSRRVQKQYDAHRDKLIRKHGANPPCSLCNLGSREALEVGSYLSVVANSFPYEKFDSQSVAGHYMIVPHRHAAQVKDLAVKEQAEYLRLQAKYLDLGYSMYTRSVHNRTSTIPAHLHTHLLKYK